MACPCCGAGNTETFFTAASAPVLCNILSPTPEAARAVPRGEIRLDRCDGCGLVYNAAFDERLMRYTGTYENALHFSPAFRRYAEDLAQGLVERHGVRGGRIIELGCGDGSFLARLCELSGAEGVGFDPAHDPDRANLPAGVRVRVVREYYGPRTAALAGWDEAPDLLVCRHTLEHIPDPRGFLGSLRTALDGGRTAVFFEVPDFAWTLRDGGIWDILYEHCLYFTAPALWGAFERAGFVPWSAGSVYGGQFLTIDAGLAGEPGAAPAAMDVAGLTREFGRVYGDKVGRWRERLRGLAAAGRSAVLWGAGTKGVMFLNIMGEDAAPVAAVVDLNPRKHGHFIAGTAQPIIPPEDLGRIDPAVVIIMNPLYRAEIESQLAALGVRADVEVA